MARRADHNRDELSTLILDAAWKVIATESENAMTARRIAADIGYAPGSIYNVFPSMEEVLLHINGRTLDLLYTTLTHPSCHNPQKTPLHNMQMMARRYIDFAHTHYPFWMTLFSSTLQSARFEHEWYAQKVQALFQPLEDVLHNALPEQHEKSLKLHARILWSSVHGITFLAVTGKLPENERPKDALRMAETLVATYMQGLLEG